MNGKEFNEIGAVFSKYLAEVVKFVTFFARELPQFTQLSINNQRLLIKNSLLEVCIVHTVNSAIFDKLDSMELFKADNSDSDSPMQNLMTDMCSCIRKLLKLELTEVEYSILAAILLFSPGEC